MSQPVLVNVSDSINTNVELILTNKFSIGRGLHNHCVLYDICVSRTHCLIEHEEDDQWMLINLSMNGTKVNGKLIKQTQNLTTGDMIALSNTTKFLFKLVQLNSNNLDEDEVLFDIIDQTITDVQALRANSDKDKPDLPKLNLTNEPESLPKSHDSHKASTEVKNKESLRDSNEVSKDQGASLNIAEDELQCSICKEMFVQAVTLSCSHTFCKYCIAQWRKNHSVCPICRGQIISSCPTRVFIDFIEKIMQNATEEVRQNRQQLIEQRLSSSSRTSAAEETMSLDYNDYDPMTSYEFMSFVHTLDLSEYNGLPGAVYGGFGFCYACGDVRHWANGCPNRYR